MVKVKEFMKGPESGTNHESQTIHIQPSSNCGREVTVEVGVRCKKGLGHSVRRRGPGTTTDDCSRSSRRVVLVVLQYHDSVK